MRFSDVFPGPRRPVQQWSMHATRWRRWEVSVTQTTLTTKHQCHLLPRVVRGVSATNQRSHDVGRNDRSPDKTPGRVCRQTLRPRIGRGTAMRKHRKTLKSNTFWRYSPKCHLKAQKITLCNHLLNPVPKKRRALPTHGSDNTDRRRDFFPECVSIFTKSSNLFCADRYKFKSPSLGHVDEIGKGFEGGKEVFRGGTQEPSGESWRFRSERTATILQSLTSGSHVISVSDVYSGTHRYCALPHGVEVTFFHVHRRIPHDDPKAPKS